MGSEQWRKLMSRDQVIPWAFVLKASVQYFVFQKNFAHQRDF
jgi:hypothetical protein